MRRSAAPSQRESSYKRPCFKAPFATKQQNKMPFTEILTESVNHSLNSNVINNVKEPRREDKQKSQVNYNQTRSTSDVLKLLLKSTSEIKEQKEDNFFNNFSEEQSKPDGNDFKSKIITSCLDDFDAEKLNIENSSINEKRIDVENDDDNCFPKYFNVMWCKLSKKKNKDISFISSEAQKHCLLL
ncbi:uncharacterized protein LOC111632843 [Centruroides sculpturatus]|uniref:uncharacterized protein LOC111632843 n=1 Tax=Centruroides sculpturatus TaxID=218467 RepID=UPI000C6E4691|nr:uncharacterized protein LOC111632843 [Centruroides sculpturatus]